MAKMTKSWGINFLLICIILYDYTPFLSQFYGFFVKSTSSSTKTGKCNYSYFVAVLGSSSKVGVRLDSEWASERVGKNKYTIGTAAIHSVPRHGNIVDRGSPGEDNLSCGDGGDGEGG